MLTVLALATHKDNPAVTLVIWRQDGKTYINNVNAFCHPDTRFDWAEEATLSHLLTTIPTTEYHMQAFC